jgi:hypothetical protein
MGLFYCLYIIASKNIAKTFGKARVWLLLCIRLKDQHSESQIFKNHTCQMEYLTLTLLEYYEVIDLEADADVDVFCEHLSIEHPDCEEGMQAAAEQLGTHADSIELVDEPGQFALYRALYREERRWAEGEPNENAERAMAAFGRTYGDTIGSYPHLCGLFLLLTPGA